MALPPSPSGPPAGWYPDPEDDGSYRWWDGTAWGERANLDFMAAGPDQHSVQVLVAETLRAAASRAGQYLAMIVAFVLPITLASALATYLGLRDSSMIFPEVEDASDPATTVVWPEFDYGGTLWALWALLVLLPAAVLFNVVFRASVARHSQAARVGSEESWFQSVVAVLRHPGRLATVALVRFLLNFSPLLLVFAVLFGSPLFILLFPLLVPLAVFVWTRLVFSEVVAGVGPAELGPVRTSWKISGRGTWAVFGRRLALFGLEVGAFLTISLLGSLVMGIAGLGSEPVPLGATTIDFNMLLGENLASFLLSNLFTGLGFGTGIILAWVGATRLYQERGGMVAELLEASDIK